MMPTEEFVLPGMNISYFSMTSYKKGLVIATNGYLIYSSRKGEEYWRTLLPGDKEWSWEVLVEGNNTFVMPKCYPSSASKCQAYPFGVREGQNPARVGMAFR